MVHILWLIIKFILILLGILLGLLLLAVLLILFCPVRYRLIAEKKSADWKMVHGEAGVSWLFEGIRVRAVLEEGKIRLGLRLLGIPLDNFLNRKFFPDEEEKQTRSAELPTEKALPGKRAGKEGAEIKETSAKAPSSQKGSAKGNDSAEETTSSQTKSPAGEVNAAERKESAGKVNADEGKGSAGKANTAEAKGSAGKMNTAEAKGSAGKMNTAEAKGSAGKANTADGKGPAGKVNTAEAKDSAAEKTFGKDSDSEKKTYEENKKERSHAEKKTADAQVSKGEISGKIRGSMPSETSAEAEKASRNKSGSFLEKLKAFLQKIREKLRGIRDSAEKIKEQACWWKDFLTHPRTKEAISNVKQKAFRLLRHIFPTMIKGNITLGFENPASTGTVLAVLGMTIPFHKNRILVSPVFDGENTAEGTVRLKGRVYGIVLLVTGLQVFFDKNVRYVIRRWKNERSS